MIDLNDRAAQLRKKAEGYRRVGDFTLARRCIELAKQCELKGTPDAPTQVTN